MLLKGFEIQCHQRTAHYLWPFRNDGLTYDAVGQIDPPSPGIGLKYDKLTQDYKFDFEYKKNLCKFGPINSFKMNQNQIWDQFVPTLPEKLLKIQYFTS